MNTETELQELKAELVALRAKLTRSEHLYKAACTIADKARSENERLAGELAKARGTTAAVLERAPTLRDAIGAALAAGRPGVPADTVMKALEHGGGGNRLGSPLDGGPRPDEFFKGS